MAISIDEILDKVRQHPRLVIVDDYELCVEKVSSQANEFVGGRSVREENESRLWLSLRLLHRKQPGRAVVEMQGQETIAHLIEQAFESARFSTPDPWFRFPIWKSLKSNLISDEDSFLPLSVCREVQELHPSFHERYEVYDREIRMIRKTERLQLAEKKRKFFSQLSISLTPDLLLFDDRAQSLPLNGQKNWAKSLQLRAIEQMDSEPFDDFSYQTILMTPPAAARILAKVAPAFLGDQIHDGKSLLGLPTGERLFSPLITLIDDGALVGGFNTSSFDDEGAPTQRTILVEQGDYRNCLFDTYSATRENRLSTGNFRKVVAENFPKVSPSNFFMNAGETPLDEMVSGISRGLVVESWDYEGFDPRSGRLALIGRGWEVEQGKPQRPVFGKAISCCIMDLMRHVVGVGNDLTFFGAFGSPSILCEDLPLSR